MRKMIPLLLLLPLAALARQGSEGGGGANKLIAEYVSTANTLIGRTGFTPEHKALLQKALDHSRIVTVKKILDPQTKQPLANQEKLIAWGSPGLVQLKEKGVLFEDSFEDAVATARPIAHIVIHELFRASGALDETGKSIDENFQLSIGKYHLEQDSTVGSAIGSDRGSQFLYAECKIVSCERKGRWSKDEDTVCDPKDKTWGRQGLLGATLSVYKYSGINNANNKQGLLMIKDVVDETKWRLGNEVISAVNILDGEEEMQIVSDRNNEYRDFRIGYSTPRKRFTTGHLEIMYIRLPGSETSVKLDLAECQTLDR